MTHQVTCTHLSIIPVGQCTTWQTLQSEIVNTLVPALAYTCRMYKTYLQCSLENCLSSCKAREGELKTNTKHSSFLRCWHRLLKWKFTSAWILWILQSITPQQLLRVHQSFFRICGNLFHTLSHFEALLVHYHDTEPMPAHSTPPGPTSLQCRSEENTWIRVM